MRVRTPAEASYCYWTARRNVLLRAIDALTEPYVLPGKEETDEECRNRLECLDEHCKRLEEWDAKIEGYAREANVPEHFWKRAA